MGPPSTPEPAGKNNTAKQTRILYQFHSPSSLEEICHSFPRPPLYNPTCECTSLRQLNSFLFNHRSLCLINRYPSAYFITVCIVNIDACILIAISLALSHDTGKFLMLYIMLIRVQIHSCIPYIFLVFALRRHADCSDHISEVDVSTYWLLVVEGALVWNEWIALVLWEQHYVNYSVCLANRNSRVRPLHTCKKSPCKYTISREKQCIKGAHNMPYESKR